MVGKAAVARDAKKAPPAPPRRTSWSLDAASCFTRIAAEPRYITSARSCHVVGLLRVNSIVSAPHAPTPSPLREKAPGVHAAPGATNTPIVAL